MTNEVETWCREAINTAIIDEEDGEFRGRWSAYIPAVANGCPAEYPKFSRYNADSPNIERAIHIDSYRALAAYLRAPVMCGAVRVWAVGADIFFDGIVERAA